MIAALHAWRGEVDAAFDWLERAYVQRETGIMSVAVDPELHALHGDPRWRPFLRRMGLEEAFDAARRARLKSWRPRTWFQASRATAALRAHVDWQ